jgi:hypothetical protein
MDIRDLWQEQPMEGRVSIEQIRKKARKLEVESRRGVVAGCIISVLLVFAFGSFLWRRPPMPVRIGFGILTVWALWAPFFFYRNMWPRGGTAGADQETCLAFYRRELERRREYERHIRLFLGICFTGLAFIVVPELVRATHNLSLLRNVAPVLVLLAIWAVLFVILKRRGRRRVRNELAALDEFER